MAREANSNDRELIAEEILSYLTEHPDAQDTLEGIAQWWLLDRRITNQTAIVREALADLVRRGLVIEETREDPRRLYRVDKNRLADITAQLTKLRERTTLG